MAKRNSSLKLATENKLLMFVIIAILAFSAGFIIARAKYKSQLKTTFNMVMEREDVINNLKEKVSNIEKKLRMEDTSTDY